MTKFGQVVSYNGDTGVATVRYARPDACDKCGACGGGGRQQTIELKAQCKEGDWVRVELPDGQFLRATALAYVIPLLCFFAGLLLGYFLSGKQETAALLSSAVGLGVGVLFLRLTETKVAGKREWTPTVTAVYDQKPEIGDIGCDGGK